MDPAHEEVALERMAPMPPQDFANAYTGMVKAKMQERGIHTRGPKSANVHGVR